MVPHFLSLHVPLFSLQLGYRALHARTGLLDFLPRGLRSSLSPDPCVSVVLRCLFGLNVPLVK